MKREGNIEYRFCLGEGARGLSGGADYLGPLGEGRVWAGRLPRGGAVWFGRLGEGSSMTTGTYRCRLLGLLPGPSFPSFFGARELLASSLEGLGEGYLALFLLAL